MENRYQLTNEEINKILCRSPRSLSASPAEQGLGAQQIKKYFYDFIYYMAQLLNMHLGAVGRDVTALDTGLVALQEALTESIADSVLDHATDADAHADIRESLAEAVHLANVAYNLASGKSKVYVNTSFQMALFELKESVCCQSSHGKILQVSRLHECEIPPYSSMLLEAHPIMLAVLLLRLGLILSSKHQANAKESHTNQQDNLFAIPLPFL